MNTFSNIKELIFTLKREEKLITEMFIKRKSFSYKLDYALELVDYDEDRINYLIQRSVIRENGGILEIDGQFLDFFEQILAVNEEINLSYINENIRNIKEHISYYFNENNENRKYGYLRFIKKNLRKIGAITLRNVVDLRRNIENTFKNEPNYKNKQSKLKHLDEKRITITRLIEHTRSLISQEEHTFFKTATDQELNQIIIEVKHNLGECSHNLIEIEKQIIDYLNQIKYQDKLIKKLRKLKYLKDQFLIEAETDIKKILRENTAAIFDIRVNELLNLSLPFLQTDEGVLTSIKKVAQRLTDKKHFKPKLAEAISEEFISDNDEEQIMINLEELRNSFRATSDNLFNFILNYDFPKEINFSERVTIYCQMVSQFEHELEIENNFDTIKSIEYALVYPKQH